MVAGPSQGSPQLLQVELSALMRRMLSVAVRWKRERSAVDAATVIGGAAACCVAASAAVLPPTTTATPSAAVVTDDEYREALALLEKAELHGREAEASTAASPKRTAAQGPQPPNQCAQAHRVVVVGGGIMGSSAAYSLARRREGHQITYIDTQHPIRSSWGQERTARTAYDDPLFVRMMQRAYLLWEQLESDDETGRQVLHKTTRLDVAPRGVLDGLRRVQTEMLGPGSLEMFDTPEALAKRFSAIRMRPGEEAMLTGGGALILASVALEVLVDRIAAWGVEMRQDTSVTHIDLQAKTVTTDSGELFQFDQLVLSCGPWTNAMLAKAGLSLLPTVVSVEQGEYYWPADMDDVPLISLGQLPSTVFFHADQTYAKPHVPGGVPGMKVAVHQQGEFIHNAEFLVADGVLPALGLLQKARKARIQPCHLATSWLLLAARTMMMMMTMMTELHGLTERFLRCACVGADLAVVLARPVCCCN